MIDKRLLICLLLAGQILFLAHPYLLAAPLDTSGTGEVKITADVMSYDKGQKAVNASGSVKLSRGETTIESERLIFFEDDNRLIASGSVVVREKDDLIEGDEVEYDFAKSSASVTGGKIFIKEENYHIEGARLEKLGENRYIITDARMTTCDGPSPDWLIRSSKVDVEIGEYLFAKHARLYAGPVPVLYFPVLVAPVKTQRQTGLLPPRFGYSNRRGFTYDQPLFLALSRSQDATLTFNYEAKRSYGGELEYRYVRTADSTGEANVKYAYENYSTSNRERWMTSFRHMERFDPSLYGKVFIQTVSDKDFFSDYGSDVGEYSRQSIESQASLVKNWTDYSLLTNFRYFENLQIEEDTTLQRLPEIVLRGNRRSIGNGPFFFQLDSRLDNFWRERTDETNNLYAGQRLDFHPSLSLPLQPGGFFELTPKLGVRDTVYRTRNKENSVQSRKLYDFELDFTLPFSRIYEGSFRNVEKVKHTIAPGFTFYRSPKRDQSVLPQYDGTDRLPEIKRVQLKLENFLVTKSLEEEEVFYNRLVEFKLFRYYDFLEADRPLAFQGDFRRPWGPVTGQLAVRPRKYFRFDSEVQYDTYQEKITQGSADFRASRSNGDRLSLSYRYSRVPDVRYLDAGMQYRLNDTFSIAYSGRYSVSDGFFHENQYGLLTERQCWSLTLTFSERRIPEERRVFVMFNLKGLGEIGSKKELFTK